MNERKYRVAEKVYQHGIKMMVHANNLMVAGQEPKGYERAHELISKGHRLRDEALVE